MDVVNVVVMAPALGPDLSYASAVDQRVRVIDANHAAGAELDAALGVADVLLVGYPVPSVLAGKAPHLAWAHHTQAGVSNLHDTDLWTSGVTLTSSRGVMAAGAIAEYVIAAAAFFARGLHEGMRQKQAGLFASSGYQMVSLSSATMGVVGLGGIGGEVARRAKALGMRVVATRRSVTAPAYESGGVDCLLPADQLLTMAAESDFLAVCAQLTAETTGMIDASVFSALKPGAVLINVARGEEVNEDALVEALSSGHLRGAVLDVYDGELARQQPRRELLELPQVLLTPHISGRGDPGHFEPNRRLFADNLRRYLLGEPLLNVVDRERGY
ncbi:MAG: D-2-hydroxyacid dehydrogenase [Actinobacteria bacterium]|nr:D-2-hydroxyacid dehydrogenase [Actinomycetota bacterium]